MDVIHYLFILFAVLIVLGLFTGERGEPGDDRYYNIEPYNNPDKSDATDVGSGASELYGWGYPEDKPQNKKKHHRRPSQYCPPEREHHHHRKICMDCDITKNKDIDKYVLKSSVPPCPDTSKYATKNMLCACKDMSKYILKSKIPKCDKVNMKDYIKKSEIPACPQCPKCPKCPTCPICPKIPKHERCKKIFEYNISEHPDFSKYTINKECNKDMSEYVRKDKCVKYLKKKGEFDKYCKGAGYGMYGANGQYMGNSYQTNNGTC